VIGRLTESEVMRLGIYCSRNSIYTSTNEGESEGLVLKGQAISAAMVKDDDIFNQCGQEDRRPRFTYTHHLDKAISTFQKTVLQLSHFKNNWVLLRRYQGCRLLGLECLPAGFFHNNTFTQEMGIGQLAHAGTLAVRLTCSHCTVVLRVYS
jgi:hypothetical protein